MEQIRVNPGQFKEVITFLKRTAFRTPTGAVKSGYLADGHSYALIEQKDAEEQTDDLIRLVSVIKITCYARPLDSSYRIEHKDILYDILSIKKLYLDYYTIIAREIQDGKS